MSKVGSPLVNWILRAFQALFGIIILGLSITLIHGHEWGSLPSSLGFTAFVGSVTILAALVGVAAGWLEFLEGIIGLAIDSFVAILNIAGGIFLAIKLRGVTCKVEGNLINDIKLATNELFNGGCRESSNGIWTCFNWFDEGDSMSKPIKRIEAHCRESQAAMVFMFMIVVLLVASGLMGFLKRRKGY